MRETNSANTGRSSPAPTEPNPFAIELDWSRWWTIIPEIVAIVCAAGLPLLIGLNVVSRYTDWYRIIWAEDIVKILFLWIVFLGGAIAVKYQAHVRMSMFVDRYAGEGLAGSLWRWLIRLSPIGMGGILLALGVPIVQLHMKRELTWLEIPSGYFSTVIPLSGALMIIYTIGSLRKTKPTRPPEHG